jgi:hypothetical protein
MHLGILSWKWAMWLYKNIKLQFFFNIIVWVFYDKDNESIP